MVPRLSPRSEAKPSPEGPNHQHGMEAGDGRRLDGPGCPPAAALLGVPPMSRREPYTPSAPEDGAKVFWKSLEDKANPAAAQRRAESEFPLGLEEAKVSPSQLVKLRRKGDDKAPAPKKGAVSDASIGRR